MDTATKIFIACVSVIPGAVAAFCFWLLERKIERRSKKEDEERNRRQKEVDKMEAARQQNELLTAKAIGASIALGEATARAVQRIPDAHCNGDMDAALEYAAKIKHEQKDFLYGQGIENLYTTEREA